jgi:hypothetical protein
MDLTGGMPAEFDLATVKRPEDDLWFGENHALWLWDEQRSLGIHLYLKTLGHLGLYGLRRETINVHLPDGTVLMSESDGPGPVDARVPRGPNLEMRNVEPFTRWEYRFDATAQPTSAEEMHAGLLRHLPLTPLAFELHGTMALPPALTGSFIPGEKTEWARQFFGGRRYEQFIRARGTIRTADGELDFAGVGMRTHRVGGRNLNTFPGHTWMMGLFPSGRAFCVNRMCGADGVAQWEEGYVSDGETLRPARAHEMTACSTALPGEPLTLQIESEAGGRSTISGTLRATNFTTLRSEDRLRFCWGIDTSRPENMIMPQGLAVYEWDGEVGAGMIERSAPVADLASLSERAH